MVINYPTGPTREKMCDPPNALEKALYNPSSVETPLLKKPCVVKKRGEPTRKNVETAAPLQEKLGPPKEDPLPDVCPPKDPPLCVCENLQESECRLREKF